ncbi:MAG: glycerate kinase, partial [Actinomycetaceae bacterium]|nr:glycerate kinase [Actinomycetaceae bacterium]
MTAGDCRVADAPRNDDYSSVIASEPERRAKQSRRSNLNQEWLVSAVAAAREKLGTMRLIVLAANAQRLTGFSGIARAHMRYGLESQTAQDLDARIGEYAQSLADAYEKTLGRSRFLSASESPNPRGEYAGAGGGLAFVIQCLGGALYSVGDLTVRSRLSAQIKEADLLLYISGAIEADLPSGPLAALDVADTDPPVVLVYDYGAIAKGELKQLGLSGAYELRPHLSFLEGTSPSHLDKNAGHEAEEALTQRVASVARTWGW